MGGSARTQRELVNDCTYAPKALSLADDVAVAEEPWQEVTMFALNLGDSNSPTVTVDVRIEAVERLPSYAVSCCFTQESFDLQILHELEGRRYRLLRTCLQHDIDPEQSRFHTKRNHVIVQLAKVPKGGGEFSRGNVADSAFPPWT